MVQLKVQGFIILVSAVALALIILSLLGSLCWVIGLGGKNSGSVVR